MFPVIDANDPELMQKIAQHKYNGRGVGVDFSNVRPKDVDALLKQTMKPLPLDQRQFAAYLRGAATAVLPPKITR